MGWVGAFTVVATLATVVFGPWGIHKVEEGHVGVYFFGGALTDRITSPGYHWKSPLSSFVNIQVTLQTDEVKEIPCGTSGGVMLYFDKIEVVNKLNAAYVYDTIKNYTTNYDRTWIYDKIHHAVNEFCSVHTLQEVYIDKFDQLDESLALSLEKTLVVWAPGIEIVAIRVTKPRIPEAIRANFEKMEAERTKLLIAAQAQKVRLKESETSSVGAIASASSALAVSRITADKEVAEKKSRLSIALIQHEMHLNREKATADSLFYQHQKEAEANEALLTAQVLYLMRVKALLSKAQIVYGDAIPKTLVLGNGTFASPTLLNAENIFASQNSS